MPTSLSRRSPAPLPCLHRPTSPNRCRPLAVALVLCAAAAAGCAKKVPTPLAPPPPPPISEWPKGVTAPLKITDQLTLAIPLQYERTAIEPKQMRTKAFISQQSDRSEARFDFFLPDFSGYTLKNYQSDSDPNKVEVAYVHAGNPHEGDPDAPGEYPPNMLKRALAESLNPSDHKDEFGLRCYQGRVPSARLTCYGPREGGENIMLTTLQPPYPPGDFPQMQARYFSKQYGGVRIAWRTHVQNLPRWREIDAQIWKFIDTWKVQAPAPASPKPKP